jgi:hypothetical protein
MESGKVMIADLVGLVVVFAALSTFILAGGSSVISHPLWLLAYLALGIIAVGLWHSQKWPVKSSECLKVSAGSLVLGAIFYLCDTAVVSIFDFSVSRQLPIWLVGTQARGPFGFVATLAICPGVTTIAFGGALRGFLLQKDAA